MIMNVYRTTDDDYYWRQFHFDRLHPVKASVLVAETGAVKLMFRYSMTLHDPRRGCYLTWSHGTGKVIQSCPNAYSKHTYIDHID